MKSSYADRRINELFSGLMASSPAMVTDDVEIPIYGDDFDIVKLMEEAKDPDTGMIRDLRIDDRDLKTGKNYLDYAFNIIGKDAHPPWATQMWTGLMLFGEVCPVCTPRKWMDPQWVVDHIDKSTPSQEFNGIMTLLENGRCKKCGLHKYELIKNHGLHNYVELVNCLGQRSGKSASAASYAGYHAHRFLKFPRLADLTSAMQKSTELTATMVSLNFDKAFSLLWTPFIKGMDESSWFKDYHAMLDHHAEKYGIELYRKRSEYVKYFHKNLKFYPSGPRASTLRGDTRILGALDELGLFPLPTGDQDEDEQSERANADEAHKSLMNSLTTVQAIQLQLLAKEMNCPPGLMIGVSSPFSHRDKVMRLLEDAKTPEGRKVILGVNLPTWKVNPHIERDHPMIVLAYARNAEKAERDYGANPPRIHNTFIKPSQTPHPLWVTKPTHAIKYCYDQPGELYAKVEKFYSPKFPSVVTLDAGHTNNSFTLTAGHFDFKRQKTVASTVLEIMTHDGRRIDFNKTYENLILPVCKDVNAVALFADQWQSIDILSRAKHDLGIAVWDNGRPQCLTKQYSPRRPDFDTLVSMMENGSIELPYLSEADYKSVLEESIEYRTLNGQPAKHLLLQMLTITDLGPGRCPTKGAGYTDDLLRALVLLTLIHREKVFERLKKADVVIGSTKRTNPIPIYVSRGM